MPDSFNYTYQIWCLGFSYRQKLTRNMSTSTVQYVANGPEWVKPLLGGSFRVRHSEILAPNPPLHPAIRASKKVVDGSYLIISLFVAYSSFICRHYLFICK